MAADSALLRQLIQRFVRDFGLLAQGETPCGKPLPTSHAHALMVLLECARQNERPTQKQLARELGIDKSNVARVCQRMETLGQLERTRSEEDGRELRLSLTTRGLRVAREVEQASELRFAALYARIPTAERRKVVEGLALLTEALTSESANGEK